MVLAILSCIGYAILAVLGVIAIVHAGESGAGGDAVSVLVVFIVFMVGIILFQIWTIIVAKNARKEIEAGQWLEYAVIQVLLGLKLNNIPAY